MSIDKASGQAPSLHDWPADQQCYLTLDFECDYGTALSKNTYEAVSHTDTLVSLLEDLDIPLTCFVQTELLDKHPEVVEELRTCDVPVEFHPHSHTHALREQTSIQDEIERSTTRYEEFFGRNPVGYRFPNGNIRNQDYRLLTEYGYEFDASLFPSWRPQHFNNASAPTIPQYLPDFDLYELPFTVYSKLMRIPTALSYCQLLGRPYTRQLTRHPPSTVVFNIHMHDLVTPPSFEDLPRFYRFIYNRGRDGFELLQQILESFDRHGRSFGTLGEAYQHL